MLGTPLIMSMKKFFTKTYGLWLTAALCCFLWGSAFPAIKTGYKLFSIEQSDTPSIILFAGVRFFLAGVLTLCIFSTAEKRLLLPNKGNIKQICILSQFQTVLQYFFFYHGLAFTSGARGSVINAASVFISLAIAALIFKMERLNANKIIGSVIGFAGVVLISLDALKGGTGGLKGEAFILLSSVSHGFSVVFMKRYSEKESPPLLSGWQFVLGGAVMTVCGFALGGRLSGFTFKSCALLLYMAMISAVAYSLWSILLKYNEVSKVTVCGFMTPVFGYFLSLLVSSDGFVITFASLAALLLVVIGIVVVNYDFKEYNKTR